MLQDFGLLSIIRRKQSKADTVCMSHVTNTVRYDIDCISSLRPIVNDMRWLFVLFDSHSRRACNETYECSYDGEYDTCDEIVLYISYYSLCIGVIFHIVFE